MIIGITGGKGGTGKTVIAVNFAVALALIGKKVTYIDCDSDCPSAHILFGAELKNEIEVHSFLPVIDNEKCIKCGRCVANCQFNSMYIIPGKSPSVVPSLCSGCKACVIACMNNAITYGSKLIGWTYKTEKFKIELFSGKLNPSESLSEKMVEAIKERAFNEGKGEIFIIDTSAGAHCPVVRALEGCDKAFAVTEPTLFGENDLKAAEKILDNFNIPHWTIVNRNNISKRKIQDAVLEIPYDRNMIDCYINGIPLVKAYPMHPITKKIMNFARELVK